MTGEKDKTNEGMTKPGSAKPQDRLTNQEIEQLRQAQDEQVKVLQTQYPNLKIR